MFSMRVALTFCLALFLAAVAGAQVARDQSSTPPARDADGTLGFPACAASATPEPDDPRWRWRLRAYNHLDCVTAIVDQALARAATEEGGRPDDENAAVTMSRADLERIRTLAWWARDAAARIGR